MSRFDETSETNIKYKGLTKTLYKSSEINEYQILYVALLLVLEVASDCEITGDFPNIFELS